MQSTSQPAALGTTIRQVWDADGTGQEGFHGEVRLTKEDLAASIPEDGCHEFCISLRPKGDATDNFNRAVRGYLRIICKVSGFS